MTEQTPTDAQYAPPTEVLTPQPDAGLPMTGMETGDLIFIGMCLLILGICAWKILVRGEA